MTDNPPSLQVQDIGEQGLLKRLHKFCPPDMVGDDAAVMNLLPAQLLVITTDMLVDGVHFSERTTSPEDAGWRAAAANLSDLAAMGAKPAGITVGLGITGTTPVSWVERLYQGMQSCLQQHNTPIVGGDIVRSPMITLSITAFGQAYPNRLIRRGAAQPGDAIVVTGCHGASRAGLELLLHPEFGQNLGPAERDSLTLAHQRPKPRLDVLPLLWEIFAQESPISVAGMDSSDGLADAIVQICQASAVGAKIERNSIPIPPALNQLVPADRALEWALYGGEDFELVLCLPAAVAQKLVNQLGAGAAIVGTISSQAGVWLIDSAGIHPAQQLTLNQGFKHF